MVQCTTVAQYNSTKAKKLLLSNVSQLAACLSIQEERQMMNFKKLAMVLFTFSLVGAVSAQERNDNWHSATGSVWTNSTGLCYRGSNWTPATADKSCDGAIQPAPKVEAPAPVAAPAPKVAAPAPAPVAASKVTYAADAFFDFDKSVLKPEGKAKLDDLASKIKSIKLEVIIAVGHTDSVGSVAYNQKLSVRRAEAVKAYLVSKGIERNRIYTEGKGKSQPVADNKTAQGRAKNRRVELEVVGTRGN
jgi:OmpA-OmpF porin, OOP family